MPDVLHDAPTTHGPNDPVVAEPQEVPSVSREQAIISITVDGVHVPPPHVDVVTLRVIEPVSLHVSPNTHALQSPVTGAAHVSPSVGRVQVSVSGAVLGWQTPETHA
jgi:hypothetical protein